MKNFLEVVAESESICVDIRSLVTAIHFHNERLAQSYDAVLSHLKKGGKVGDKHGQVYNVKKDCDKNFALDLLISTIEAELEKYYKFLANTTLDSLA